MPWNRVSLASGETHKARSKSYLQVRRVRVIAGDEPYIILHCWVQWLSSSDHNSGDTTCDLEAGLQCRLPRPCGHATKRSTHRLLAANDFAWPVTGG